MHIKHPPQKKIAQTEKVASVLLYEALVGLGKIVIEYLSNRRGGGWVDCWGWLMLGAHSQRDMCTYTYAQMQCNVIEYLSRLVVGWC